MRSQFNKPIDIELKWADMGYHPDTISLLFVAPLVQMAWAEGFVQAAERRTILRLAADLKIEPRTNGWQILGDWLDVRPSDEFFTAATNLLNYWLETMPPPQGESLRNVLLIGCLEVARSSADIGLHPRRDSIRREEHEKLFQIGNQLGFMPAAIAA